jgi:hypothetical protein
MTPTPIVELLSPALGAILSGPSPTLRWVQPAGAMEAHLQVCAAPDCNRVEYGFTDRMGSNTHRVGTTLTQGRHWWRVSATSASGPWSMMRSFEVRGRGLAAGALGTTPDFTSDGVHDLVTGLPGFFGGGQVWLYPGRPTGLDPTTPFLVTRSTTGAFYGERMAAVGDMNGDGTLDLAVYAPPSGVDGSIHILGGSSTGLAGTPAYRLEPPSGAGPTSFGESFAGVGDLNGDGLADVIAGAPAFGAGAGRVWLFLGVRAGGAPVATPLDSPGGTGGRFGNVVAGLGDFNGDGLGDFAVHAPDRLGGTTYVYLGAADGRPRLAHSFESPSGMSAGTRLAGGFDFDGDGLGDLAVSSPTAMADGLVYLYYGASGTRESFPDDVLSPPLTSESFFGVAVAPAGDIDGDGLDDLIVAQGGRDHVHVFAGAARSFSHRLLATVQRPSDGAAFFTTGYGKALAALDLNGDGRRDLVIGAYNDAGGGGRVYVHTQVPTGGVPAAPTLVLTGAAGARLGGSFAQ